ncbi:ribulose-phosphate 3-epimerase [Candidatus Avelusimicrobium luingense]|uniref:ribulose-phosphate 3-epimerase n=1 Tax=Candidatus Avelusimicrobium luingense TaxID=3416211 RepID=UPI003D0F655E
MTSKIPPANGKIYVAPSLLSADLWQLGQDVQRVELAGADWLHVDVMDGHFVPNLSFGPALVRSLKKNTSLPLDVHLMVEHPARFIEPFTKAGADLLTVHLEAQDDVKDVLKQIHALGIKVGVSIKPDTDVRSIIPVLEETDLILVMSVYPGFGGQEFLPEAPERIRQIRQLITKTNRPVWLEVDGGINAQTAREVVQAGADVLVAGNAIFSAKDPAVALKQIKQAS